MSIVALDRSSRPLHDGRTAWVEFTTAQAQELLKTKFAPWVQDLGLIVEHCWEAGARLRLPFSSRITRVGGTVCGQA